MIRSFPSPLGEGIGDEAKILFLEEPLSFYQRPKTMLS